MKKDFSTKKLLEEIIDETVSNVFSEEFIGTKGGVRYFQMGGSLPDALYNLDSKGKPTRDPGVAGLKKSSKKKAKKKHSEIVGESRAVILSLLKEILAQEIADNTLNEDTGAHTPAAKRGVMPSFGGASKPASKNTEKFDSAEDVFKKLQELVKNEAAVKEAFDDPNSSLRPAIVGIANFFSNVPVEQNYKGANETYIEAKSKFWKNKAHPLYVLFKNNEKSQKLFTVIVQKFLGFDEFQAASRIMEALENELNLSQLMAKRSAEYAGKGGSRGSKDKPTQFKDFGEDYTTFATNVQKNRDDIEKMIKDIANTLGSDKKSIKSYFVNTLNQALGKKKTDINAEFIDALKAGQGKEAPLSDRVDTVVKALEKSLSALPKAKTAAGKKAIQDLMTTVSSKLAAPPKSPKVFKRPTAESRIFNHLFEVNSTNNAFACALLLFALSE